MNDQTSPGKNQKSGRVSKKLGHFAKTDVRFWQDRLFRETYRKNGGLRETSHWSARIQYAGRRERFPLYTPNKAAAAAKARDLYVFLAANGWEATLARYRKPKAVVHEHNGDRPITVGAFLEAVLSVSTSRSTIEGYAIAFRKIVADLFGFASDPSKFDYRSGGRAEWLTKVHAVELSKVTPAKIQEWKQSFLTVAGNDPLALRKARISVNTFLRRSRSLFSRKVLRQLELKLPSPLPFDGVEFEPRQSMKYRSEFDVIDLIRQAKSELGSSDPAAYMIFLLAITAGLRRKEIDLLEWPSFRFKDNVIRIEPTQFFHPKSQDSIGEIQMDPQIMAVFREYRAKAKGNFVIPSGRPPKAVPRGDYYRCEPHFDTLNAWLRGKQVNTQKPLHTLRKEYGSLINKIHGIHAASKALRHADISVTNNFYTDSRARVTPRLGKLFISKEIVRLQNSVRKKKAKT
jgi:integrase